MNLINITEREREVAEKGKKRDKIGDGKLEYNETANMEFKIKTNTCKQKKQRLTH